MLKWTDLNTQGHKQETRGNTFNEKSKKMHICCHIRDVLKHIEIPAFFAKLVVQPLYDHKLSCLS